MKQGAVIHLILNAGVSTHVSEDTVAEFEHTILSCPQVLPSQGEIGIPRLFGAVAWKMYEASKSVPLSVRLAYPLKNNYFAVLMGVRFRKCLPYFSFAKKNICICLMHGHNIMIK
jgi:hypothetical protein